MKATLLLTALLLTACTTSNTNMPVPTSPAATSSVPITESTSQSTTLTQIFENEQFSFRHPADIKPEKRSDEGIQLIKRGPTQRTETELYDGLSINFTTIKNTKNQNLQDYVNELVEGTKMHGQVLKQPEQVTINGTTGYTYTGEGLGQTRYYIFENNTKDMFIVVYDSTVEPEDRGYRKLAEEIINTLQIKN